MEVNKIIQGDCLEKLKELEDNSIDSIVTDPPYGISFMGKKWDYDVPSVEVWQECLRVLKPGGHALVACGTRTQHRMAVNLEDAGFEIRDIVAWVYGSGFPKSHNVANGIDKKMGHSNRGHAISSGSQIHPTTGKKRANGELLPAYKSRSPESKQWEGWGTALKPAMELWTLCRKPLSEKTVAENVLKWGTGGINIDGCRVEYQSKEDSEKAKNGGGQAGGWMFRSDKPQRPHYDTGRFPANLIHDGSEEVVEKFPDTGKSGTAIRRNGNASKGIFPVSIKKGSQDVGFNDSGSAARFFYCAKASKSERNKGLEGFEKQTTDDGRQKSIDNAFQRGETERHNNHPTVKPIKLMQYLVRLITPKGGTTLDPYIGSGSTGIGAKLEGFDFIGIEREEEYVKIAEARIAGWEIEKQQTLL